MTTKITYQQYYGSHLVSAMSNTYWSGCLVCFKFPSEAEELMPHTSRVMELNTIKAKIMITTPKPTWTLITCQLEAGPCQRDKREGLKQDLILLPSVRRSVRCWGLLWLECSVLQRTDHTPVRAPRDHTAPQCALASGTIWPKTTLECLQRTLCLSLRWAKVRCISN